MPKSKGGRITDQNGYILIMNRNHPFHSKVGYIREHRLVYEESRNCCLLRWTEVHHKDGDIRNNIWYNLQPLSKSQHAFLSNTIYSPSHKCTECGSERSTIRKNSGNKRWVRGMCKRCEDKKRSRKRGVSPRVVYPLDHRCIKCGSENTDIKNGTKRWRRGMCYICSGKFYWKKYNNLS